MNEIRPVGPTHPIVPIQRQDHPPPSKQPRRPKNPREEATEDDENNTPTINEYV